MTMSGMKNEINPTEGIKVIDKTGNSSGNDSLTKQLSKDFLENCGLHGINKMSPGKENRYRRFAWLVLILGCAGYLLYTVTTEIRTYYTYPTTTRVRVERSQIMDFPAVTICNLSPYNKSKLPSDEKFLEFFMACFGGWSEYASPINLSDPLYQTYHYITPLTPDFIKNVSMEAEKMFFLCKFDKIFFNCLDKMTPVLTEFGLCYTFNKDGLQKTSRSGANFNLEMEIFIDSVNYYFGTGTGSGIKILVHDPYDIPDLRSEGFLAAPGTGILASIKPRVMQNMPFPYKSANDDYCLDVESSDFRNPLKHLNYTSFGCMMECNTNYQRELTGCIIPKYDGDEPPYCALINWATNIKNTVKAYIDPAVYRNCSDKCTSPCITKHYDTKVSYAKYPSSFYMYLINKLAPMSLSEEFLSNNFLHLNVFFERLETTYMEQTALYTSVGNVLANVGGQMGLFLGASLLTLTEIMEFVIRLVVHSVYRKLAEGKR